MVEGDEKRSAFLLPEEPDITLWLRGMVNFILAQQGKGEIEVAMRQWAMPAEETLNKLLSGGVIFAVKGPDGKRALSLNSEMQFWLLLKLRLANEPARLTQVGLAQKPELAVWLLNYYLDGAVISQTNQPSEDLAKRLHEHGVFVDRLPPEDAYFPTPDNPMNLTSELETAVRVFPQRAGEPIPPEVRNILGKHTPALPPNTDLLWGEDAGTGLMFPSLLEEGVKPQELENNIGTEANRRTEQWDKQRQDAQQALATQRYTELRQILPLPQRAKVRRYMRELVEGRYFPALGDGQVELRAGIHNEPTAASIHNGLAELVSSIANEDVIASYCYLGYYEGGAVLERHRDRPQCIYNLSVVLDMYGPKGDPEPWPIFLEVDGQPRPVSLQIGDGLLYSGTELWHWREALPKGRRAIVCFYHFVPRGFGGTLD